MNDNKKIHTISFLVALALFIVLVGWMVSPFLNLLAFAFIAAIIFYPINKWLVGKIKSPSLASFLTLLLILLFIAVPLAFFGRLLVAELAGLYNRYRAGVLVLDRSAFVQGLPEQVVIFLENLNRGINNYVGAFAGRVFSSLTEVLSNVARFFLSVFMFFFITFFLLRDGKKLLDVLKEVLPIAGHQQSQITNKIISSVNGVVKGAFLIALIQGVVATVGYFIFQIPQPVIWGALTVLAALIPNVGTSIALVPAVLYLAITGQSSQAIGMAIWGVIAVGLVDNIVGPRLISGSTRLHPVLVLLSVVGGLQLFGILGFLIGPILMSVFVAMIDIYRTDFQDYLKSK